MSEGSGICAELGKKIYAGISHAVSGIRTGKGGLVDLNAPLNKYFVSETVA